MTIYAYKIGWGSYEESDYTELYHTSRFGTDALERLVFDAVVEVLENIIVDRPTNFSFLEDGISYSEIHDDVIETLIVKRGFSKVQYEAEWGIVGWPSITCDKSWSGQRGTVLDRLHNTIPEQVSKKINSMAKSWHDDLMTHKAERRSKR